MGFLKEKYKKEIDYSNNLAKQIDAHTDKFSEVFDSFPKEAVIELYNIQAEKDENMMRIYSKAEAEIFRPVIDSKDNEHFSYDDDFYVMKDDGTFFSGNTETILNKFVDIDNLKEFVMESCRENVPVLLIIRKYSEWADEFDRLMNDWEYYSQIPLKVCLFDKILEG